MGEIIAVFGLTNTASVNIYEIDHGAEDRVLAGINNEKPEWCDIYYSNEHEELDIEEDETPYFLLDELVVPLNQCMRL